MTTMCIDKYFESIQTDEKLFTFYVRCSYLFFFIIIVTTIGKICLHINVCYLSACSYYLLKMRALAFLLLLLLIVGCNCNIQVLVNQKGEYNITIDNEVWLRSARTAIYVDDRWYSTDDNSLPLLNITGAQGTDPLLGNWNETQFVFNLVRKRMSTVVVARIRQWSILSAFTFHLDTGDQDLTNRVALDMEQVRTVFPSFHIEQMNANDERGYFTYGGQ
jgi:hypothetical protein